MADGYTAGWERNLSWDEVPIGGEYKEVSASLPAGRHPDTSFCDPRSENLKRYCCVQIDLYFWIFADVQSPVDWDAYNPTFPPAPNPLSLSAKWICSTCQYGSPVKASKVSSTLLSRVNDLGKTKGQKSQNWLCHSGISLSLKTKFPWSCWNWERTQVPLEWHVLLSEDWGWHYPQV